MKAERLDFYLPALYNLLDFRFVRCILMKYMTFNSSCSYAGIANMLEQYGIDTCDRTIALEMKLPFLFSYCDGVYLSGPMLQTAQWFDLYLNPLGYALEEKILPAEKLADYLKKQRTAMLGIKMDNAGKHAVVYTGVDSEHFVFLNNKWETEEAPIEIRLTTDELMQRTDAEVAVATLRQINPTNVDLAERIATSIPILKANFADIVELCDIEETVGTLRSKLNTLFRPLFLDGITMLSLIGETDLAAEFADRQAELLTALRHAPTDRIMLKDYISIDKFRVSVEKYIELINAALNSAKHN